MDFWPPVSSMDFVILFLHTTTMVEVWKCCFFDHSKEKVQATWENRCYVKRWWKCCSWWQMISVLVWLWLHRQKPKNTYDVCWGRNASMKHENISLQPASHCIHLNLSAHSSNSSSSNRRAYRSSSVLAHKYHFRKLEAEIVIIFFFCLLTWILHHIPTKVSQEHVQFTWNQNSAGPIQRAKEWRW